jgi:beta-N-acetylhexosaminidase
VLVLAAAGAAVAVSSSGSSNPGNPYAPGAAQIATVITGSAPAVHVPHAAAFVPAPAATRLAATLSLPQQVAQLFLVSLDGRDASAGLGQVPWGGVVFTSANFVSDGQVQSLAGDISAAARSSGAVAPLLAATQAGGPETAFPDLPPEGEAQIGATGRSPLARAQALAAAKALRALGFAMTIAPLADVDTEGGALSGRLFSTDPAAVARFSLAAIDGYRAGGLIAAAAHFPGEGSASADPGVITASVGGSLAQLEAHDLIPFAAIAGHAPVIELSNAEYTAFDGVTPASLLPAAVKLLRDTYGFTGVVMSDDLDATLNPTGETPGQVAVQALDAGDDLLYISGPLSEHVAAYDAVLAAAQRSARTRALVHEALLRDLTLKASAGLVP